MMQDTPLLPVPDDVLQLIVARASDELLLSLRLVCTALYRLASDCDVWKPRAEAAWKQKLAGELLKRWRDVSPAWHAYHGSLKDAVRRNLSTEELASFPFWCFRFKAAAGDSWIAQDPWWNFRDPIKLRLSSDGSIFAVNDARPFWGKAGQRAGSWKISNDGVATVVDMNGHPPYVVYRHAATWGVYMESCWCIWTAFEMPMRGDSPDLEDEALKVTAADPAQHRAVVRYNAGMASNTY